MRNSEVALCKQIGICYVNVIEKLIPEKPNGSHPIYLSSKYAVVNCITFCMKFLFHNLKINFVFVSHLRLMTKTKKWSD